MICVSIPYYGVPDLVERCVRSVLAQTMDLRCLVIGDGEEPPLRGIRDSRLDVFVLPRNRGPYFAQQVSLLASPDEWWAPVGADDWLDPDHLEQLATYETDVATGAVWFHLGGRVKVVRKLYEVGLYRTARMLAVGGYNPAERIGQDSLTLHVMRLVAPMPSSTQPTYHRVSRRDSLSTHPQTKKGSPARTAMRERNRAIAAVCAQLRSAAGIKAYRASLVPADVAEELAEQAALLSARLGTAVAA